MCVQVATVDESDLRFVDSAGSGATGALPTALDIAFSAFFGGAGLALGPAVLGSGAFVSVTVDTAGIFAGLGSEGAGCIDAVLGELVALVFVVCDIGSGAIPVDANTG